MESGELKEGEWWQIQLETDGKAPIFDMADVELTTNLSQLPYGLFSQLARQIDSSENFWRELFSDEDRNSPYFLSSEECERAKRMAEPGAHLIRMLGNRGQTVISFLTKLHSLAKIYGPKMDIPQLILHRRFCPVIWSRLDQVIVSIDGDEGERLKLQCKSSGFPTPQFQWLEEDRPLQGAIHSSLVILRCSCTARNVFRCRVWNEVEEGQEWSEFYRMDGKQFRSELISDLVNLSRFLLDGPNKICENCYKEEMEDLARKLGNNESANDGKSDEEMMLNTMATEELVATDKVALIISNRIYAPQMTNLITPHCDAETLAEALQQLKFKTVTLGDLNLAEMKGIVQEYRKLLGEGVYAIFYFVGHGFEANGQCYLLPIGAPAKDYWPENCLSMDWVKQQFRREFTPALNLILLDMCRKFLPTNLDAFIKHSEQFKKGDQIGVNRNTVCGYATSEGIGAHEVKGEQNGVFMKYLKKRIHQPRPLLDMLNKLFLDIERDTKVCDVQIPELRSNLTKPRSLRDPIVFEGHTTSYDHHTLHWRMMHELPVPVYVEFRELKLQVTIWFDFCGHFTNKVYVFSSVGDLSTKDEAENGEGGGKEESSSEDKMPSAWALSHLAYLKFPEEFESTQPKLCEDDEEGVSLCLLLSHLQRAEQEELGCRVEIRDRAQRLKATQEWQNLGPVLITRLGLKANAANSI